MNSYYSEKELPALGLKSYGNNVKISRYAHFYCPNQISIGDNVRIDDFCIISGNVTLGSNIHISAYVALYGSMGIEMEDYTGVSPMSTIYSAMDDFSGDYLIGPIHSQVSTNVTGGKVTIKRYSQIGTHCVVFPNLTIEEGTVVGAKSLVNKNLESWSVYWGVPANKKKNRNKGLLSFVR